MTSFVHGPIHTDEIPKNNYYIYNHNMYHSIITLTKKAEHISKIITNYDLNNAER